VYGEGKEEVRFHVTMTREAYNKALEELRKETAPISHARRSEIITKAAKEFPLPEGWQYRKKPKSGDGFVEKLERIFGTEE
jgi:hypothetical protein